MFIFKSVLPAGVHASHACLVPAGMDTLVVVRGHMSPRKATNHQAVSLAPSVLILMWVDLVTFLSS